LTPRPRSFIATDPGDISRETMLAAVTHGRANTAMQSFANTISVEDIALVVDFVRDEFMRDKAVNTRYHTVENGWPKHEQYADAFPFALGDILLDTPDAQLSPTQLRGKRIFMQGCVTCHDRAKVADEGVIWDARPVSFPRNQYSHRESERSPSVDSMSEASPYARHERAPVLANLTVEERAGEHIFQKNCAFCHAPDGTGKNWIGSFLEPHPRNLTDEKFMSGMTRQRLTTVIRKGLPGTTMPAWGGVLDGEQIAAVVAYVNRAFHPLADGAISAD